MTRGHGNNTVRGVESLRQSPAGRRSQWQEVMAAGVEEEVVLGIEDNCNICGWGSQVDFSISWDKNYVSKNRFETWVLKCGECR